MNNFKKTLVYGVLLSQSLVGMAKSQFTIANFPIGAGQVKAIPVSLTNDADVKLFQLNVTLPDGLNFVTDDEGNAVFTVNGERMAAANMLKVGAPQGTSERTITALFFTTDANKAVKAGEGEVFSLLVYGNEGKDLDENGEVKLQSDGVTEVTNTLATWTADANVSISGAKYVPAKTDDVSTATAKATYLNFDPSKNFLSYGNTAPQAVRPTQKATIMVNLTNEVVYGGIEGDIVLSKGLKVVENSVVTSGRFENAEMTKVQTTPKVDGDNSTYHFLMARNDAKGLKDNSGWIFTFDVEGEAVDYVRGQEAGKGAGLDVNEGLITIKNVKGTNETGLVQYDMTATTLDLAVANDNEPAKTGEDGTDAYLKLWAETSYDAKVDAIDAKYIKSKLVTDLIDAADAAITALETAVEDAYEHGTLATADLAAKKADVEAKVNAISDAAAAAQAATEAGKVTDALAVKADEIPSEYRENPTIKANDAAYQSAKTTLEGAVAAAETAGTAGDEGVYDAKISAYNTAMAELNQAIKDAEAQAAIEAGKIADAIANNPVKTIPGEYAENADIKAAKADFDTAETNLNGAEAAAKTAGTAGNENVYSAEITAYEAAVAALNGAIEAAEAAAAAEAAKIAAAINDNPVKTIPAKYAENEAIKTAKTAFDKAETDLNGAEAAAKAEGKAAEAGVYAAEITAYVDAVTALNDAIDAADAQAAIEAAKVTDALDPANNPKDASKVKNDAEVAAKTAAYEKAKTELEGAVAAAEAAGTAGNAGVHDGLISAYETAVSDLNDAIDAAEAAAAAEAAKIADAIANNPVETIPGEYAENEAIKTAKTAFDKAETDLNGAQAAAEAAGDAAKAGVYDEVISAYEAAVTGLNNAISDAKTAGAAKDDAVQEAVDAAQAIIDAATAGTPDVEAAKTEAVQAIADLQKAVDDAEADGTKADVDLTAAIEKVNEKAEALDEANKAAAAGSTALSEVADELDEVFNDTTDSEGNTVPSFVSEEIAKAKVNTSDADYSDLLAAVADIATANADVVSKIDPATLTAAELDDAIADAKADIADIKTEVQQAIVAWLQENQLGDANGDGRLSIQDYTTLALAIANGTQPKADVADDIYEFARANANYAIEKDAAQEPKVSVADMTAIVNIIRFGDPQGEAVEPLLARAAKAQADEVAATLTANGNSARIAISLNNSLSYTSYQMDVVLPEGMTIAGTELSQRDAKHSVLTGMLQNGAQRFVVSSASNEAISGNAGDVLYINVELSSDYQGGSIEFQNVIFSDLNAGAHELALAAVAGETTGISGVAAQAAQGEQVYSISGRVMNALKKGINIIRRADGTTQKVIKK